jgi:hypothetical protein
MYFAGIDEVVIKDDIDITRQLAGGCPLWHFLP